MTKRQSGSSLGLRLVSPYGRFWHAEAHLSGGCAAVFNSVLARSDGSISYWSPSAWTALGLALRCGAGSR
jgi:hypothetical protein